MNNPHDIPIPILRFFAWGHLPAPLAQVSKPFCLLAYQVAETVVHDEEQRDIALQKLLEAKDAAVRSVLGLQEGDVPDIGEDEDVDGGPWPQADPVIALTMKYNLLAEGLRKVEERGREFNTLLIDMNEMMKQENEELVEKTPVGPVRLVAKAHQKLSARVHVLEEAGRRFQESANSRLLFLRSRDEYYDGLVAELVDRVNTLCENSGLLPVVEFDLQT